MALFGKKKEDVAAAGPAGAGLPIDMINDMRQQGYSDDDIVKLKFRSGYEEIIIKKDGEK